METTIYSRLEKHNNRLFINIYAPSTRVEFMKLLRNSIPKIEAMIK